MDAALIAGKFLEEDVFPKELRWIYRYFDTEVQRQFARYVFVFKSTERFIDHTGCRVTPHWLKKLYTRFEFIVGLHKQARTTNDFETVATIESGEYKF